MDKANHVAEIKRLLDLADWDGLVRLHASGSSVLRRLISLTYDKADPRSWRAMQAIGAIAAALPPDAARTVVQRLLWMMREESGTNPWSAGEIIAEILWQRPGPLEDIAPIVISFHVEPILRIGALWAIVRLATVRPDLVAPFAEVPREYLGSDNPTERGFAVLAMKALGLADDAALAPLRDDTATFRYYNGRDLVEALIASLLK